MFELLKYIGSIALLIIILFALAAVIHFISLWRRKKGSDGSQPEDRL